MRVTRIGLLAAVCMTVWGVCEAEVTQKVDGGIWGDATISETVKRLRAGQTMKFLPFIIINQPKSTWQPVKKNLPTYHACLGTNENPRVQFFAVAAIYRLKDKSSVAPLQAFILAARSRLQEGSVTQEEEERNPAKAAQRRLKGNMLSEEDSHMLRETLGGAIETLGVIDGDRELDAAFLGTLLKQDMRNSRSDGAFAHSALAKKGLPGLRRLLEASQTTDGEAVFYVISAIREIRDPALIPALYAACLDSRYAFNSVACAALEAIASMREQAPEAEQRIIDILKRDEQSHLRLTAVRSVAAFETEKGFKLLRDIRNAPGKGGEELVHIIDIELLRHDTDNMIDGLVKTILSPATPDVVKIGLCLEIPAFKKDKVSRHASALVPCLTVASATGEPLNPARIAIWLALYRATGMKHPLTLLPYENDQRFKDATSQIRDALRQEYSFSKKQPAAQHEKMAEEATKQLITIWDKGTTGKPR